MSSACCPALRPSWPAAGCWGVPACRAAAGISITAATAMPMVAQAPRTARERLGIDILKHHEVSVRVIPHFLVCQDENCARDSMPLHKCCGWVAIWVIESERGVILHPPRTCRTDLERKLQPELHVSAASRTDERIAGRDVGRGAPAAESAGTFEETA